MAIVNPMANRIDNVPRANARLLVLGFNLSWRTSAIRLNAIAALRPPTMATTIQVNCQPVGKPFRANNAPINAKGRAKTVCSNLIMSNVIFNLRRINS